MNPAFSIIEEVYGLTLNPTQDYLGQLDGLSISGELANHTNTNKILLKLCMIVDKQAKEIQALKDDREAIAKKMIDLENMQGATTTNPTQPLK